jgi:hypothetical protein
VLPALRAFGSPEIRMLLIFAPHPTHKTRPPLLVGLWAFEVHRSGTGMPFSVLRSWRHPACHLGTPLVRDGYLDLVMRTTFDWIAGGGAPSGVVNLQELRGDGAVHAAILDELNRRGWTHVADRRTTRAFFAPAADAETYLGQALAGKRRKELRRLRDRLAEQGALTTEILPPDAPSPTVDRWSEDFLALEAAGWKGRDGDALVNRPGGRAFFLEAMREAHARGLLEMLALRLDGRTIALKCNLLAAGGSFAFKIAYDEAFARFSPGVLLELENVRRRHERDDRRWMDSCAHHARFMINHLWTARRPVEWLAFATGRRAPGLLVSLLPALSWLKNTVQTLRGATAPSGDDEGGNHA